MFGLERLFGRRVDYKQLLRNGAVILDVRTPDEFAMGHIKGSRNISVDQVQRHITGIKKLDKPVITCCRSGARSGMVAGILKAAGIEAYNGGSWQSLQKQVA
jgi:rhodanese-related sulfurtransferase